MEEMSLRPIPTQATPALNQAWIFSRSASTPPVGMSWASAIDPPGGIPSGKGFHFRGGHQVEVAEDGMLERRGSHGELKGMLGVGVGLI